MTQPTLAVWFGPMPESNGKKNWSVVLHPKDATGFDLFTKGFQVHRSEYCDRARYDADCLRHMIGELAEEPSIVDYDGDLTEPASKTAINTSAAAEIAAVLSIDVKGRPGVRGQTMGFDGSGQFAYIIRGTAEQADKWAREHIRKRERAGQRFNSCVLVFNDEGYSGPMITDIDATPSPL